MKETVVHDCAATGLYIGDSGSHGCIQKCNIIRNGGGSRIQHRRMYSINNDTFHNHASDDYDSVNDDSIDHMLHDLDDDYNPPGAYMGDLVPPGHSGMYVETGNATVEDSLLAGNSLTGLSVVREGRVTLWNNDITLNGTEAVTIEDAHDMHLGNDERRIRGGVTDLGGNNYGTAPFSRMGMNRSDYNYCVSLGGFIRPTPFSDTLDYNLTEKQLRHFRVVATG